MKTEASRRSENWRTALTAVCTSSEPDNDRLVTCGTVAELIAVAVRFTVALPELVSA